MSAREELKSWQGHYEKTEHMNKIATTKKHYWNPLKGSTADKKL